MRKKRGENLVSFSRTNLSSYPSRCGCDFVVDSWLPVDGAAEAGGSDTGKGPATFVHDD